MGVVTFYSSSDLCKSICHGSVVEDDLEKYTKVLCEFEKITPEHKKP